MRQYAHISNHIAETLVACGAGTLQHEEHASQRSLSWQWHWTLLFPIRVCLLRRRVFLFIISYFASEIYCNSRVSCCIIKLNHAGYYHNYKYGGTMQNIEIIKKVQDGYSSCSHFITAGLDWPANGRYICQPHLLLFLRAPAPWLNKASTDLLSFRVDTKQ